jgi:hypothetical protein
MRNLLRLSLLLLGILCTTAAAHAQAIVTADRTHAVTPFAQWTLVSPDWGPSKIPGYTIGVDYTRFIHLPVQPSFEVRTSAANGKTVNEHTYLGGFQLQVPFRRISPYVTFLGGYGGIHYNYFNGGYTGDHSLIYSLGGGAEIPIAPYIRLRLDYTRQSWNIAPQTINPVALSAGIAFTLPGSRSSPR